MEEEEFLQINRPKTSNSEQNSGIPGPYVPVKNPIGMVYDYLTKEEPKASVGKFDPNSEEGFKINQQVPSLGLGEVAGQAIVNFPSSAVGVAQSMVEPFLNPVQTAESIGQIGKGVYSKAAGALGAQQDPAKKEADESAANAMRDYFADRYGSWEGFKRAVAKDPASVMADISVPLTLGGSAAARAPGLAGKAGQIVSSAGQAIDPINLALKGTSAAVEKTAKYAAAPFMSLRSGASLRSLQQAVDAGATANPDFWKFYTKQAKPDEAIAAFSQAINDVRDARNAAYQKSMQGIKANQTPLPFTHIDNTINKQLASITSVGKASNQTARQALDEANAIVNQWKNQPNAPGANSMADMDALKQRLSELRNSYKSDPNADRVITNIRKSVYDTIAARDKNYAAIMDAYGEATVGLKQIQNTLQLGKDAGVGKEVRNLLKAQNSTAGGKVLDDLDKYNPQLKYMLAGMELSEFMPYGNYRRFMIGAEGLGQFAGQLPLLAGLNPVYAMGHFATLPFTMPAVSGGTLGGVGAVSGAAQKAADIYNKVPAMVRMPSYAVGSAAEEAAPEDRAFRASGGRVDSKSIGARLVAAADRAKKEINKSTEPLLKSDDESIAKALEIANRHI